MKTQIKVFPPIRLELLKKFAHASGDNNPIHQDVEVAKKMGLPGVIAHGMLISTWVMGFALQMILEKSRIIQKTETRFRAMAFLNDEITVLAEWKEDAVLLLSAKNQRDEVVLTCVVETGILNPSG